MAAAGHITGVNWASPLNRGLVAWYPMLSAVGNWAEDLTENNYRLFMSNMDATTDWVSSPITGLALDFDGANDYCGDREGGTSFHYPMLRVPGTRRYAISAWVRTDDPGSEYIIGMGNTTDNDPILALRLTAGKFDQFWRNDVGSGVTNTGSLTVNDGVWRHVVITNDSANQSLFVNGKIDGTPASSGSGAMTVDTFTIGALRRSTIFGNCRCAVTDVRVYDRPLSAPEVSELYQASRQGYRDEFLRKPRIYSIPFEPRNLSTIGGAVRRKYRNRQNLNQGLVAHYPMTQAPGATLKDHGPHKLDGTLTNMNGADWVVKDGRRCLHLDGTSEVIISDAGPWMSHISVSVWFKVETFDVNWQALIAKGESTNWRIHRSNATNVIATKGLGGADVQGTVNINDSKWHHVVMTQGGSDGVNTDVTNFMDGKVDVLSANAVTAQSLGPFTIGDNPDSSGRNWKGWIGEIRIYDRQLTKREVRELYDLGKDGKHHEPTVALPIKSKPNTSKVGVRRKTTGGTSGSVTGVNWSSPLNKGLVAWYPTDKSHGNAPEGSTGDRVLRDIAGQNHGITVSVGSEDWRPATYPGGRLCLDLNGSTEYARIPAAAGSALDLDDELTVALWVWLDVRTDEMILMRHNAHDGSQDIQMYVTGNEIIWRAAAAAGAKYAVNANQWYHVVATIRSAGRYDLWVDGKWRAFHTPSGNPGSNSEPWLLGADSDSAWPATPGNYLDGRIADVRFYNRAFTHTDEVRALYEESKQGYPNALIRSGGPAIPASRHHSKPVLSSPTEADITDTTVTIGASTTITD